MTECKYNCLIASSAALTKFHIFTTYQLTFANFILYFSASDGLLMLVLKITMNSPLSWCGDHDQKFVFCLSVIKPARLSALLSMLIKSVLFVARMLYGVIFIIDTKIRYYFHVRAAMKTTTTPGIRQETHSVRGMNAQRERKRVLGNFRLMQAHMNIIIDGAEVKPSMKLFSNVQTEWRRHRCAEHRRKAVQ